jgi:hypothetical protein
MNWEDPGTTLLMHDPLIRGLASDGKAKKRSDEGTRGSWPGFAPQTEVLSLIAEDARAALEKAGLADRAGGVLVTGGWITQDDRERWQGQAAAELALIILEDCGGLPCIAWTADPAGPVMKKSVSSGITSTPRRPAGTNGHGPTSLARRAGLPTSEGATC